MAQARNILWLYSKGCTQKCLAVAFRVSQPAVSQILNQRKGGKTASRIGLLHKPRRLSSAQRQRIGKILTRPVPTEIRNIIANLVCR